MAQDNKGPVWQSAAMAKFLGITPRRLQQLESEGVIEKQSRGKWYMMDTTQRYISYLQLHAHGSNGPSGKDDEGDPGSITDENILLKQAKRKTIEMKNKKIAGELHDSKTVEALLNGMVATVRTKLLALPTKLAATVSGMRDTTEIQALLDGDIREALTELSEYDPSKFVEDLADDDDDDSE